MAKVIIEIGNPNIPVSVDDDDDEILVLYATPPPIKNGTSMLDAIPVENYPLRTRKASCFNDDVQLVESIPKRARVYKDEPSSSKTAEETKQSIPLTFTCEICAHDKPVSDSFRVLGCSHFYCTECIGKYVASQLRQSNSVIKCPVPRCDGFLEPHHCRSILPNQVFERWGDALCEAMILASEKFYCPFTDCSALLIIDEKGRNGKIVVQSECPYCNRLFCVQCRVPWHSAMACEEFKKLKEDERNNDDILLMNLAKTKKWMRCSKCKFYVEKSSGCLLMRCRCGFTFCYNCGAPMSEHYCHNCKH